MAQGPFNLALQRVADALGRLLPPQRAIRFLAPFTTQDEPSNTVRGASGTGEVTGYTAVGLDTTQLPGVITSRIVTGTAPLRVNGGDSSDLGAGNITLTIEPATTLAPGSLSAADKTKLDSVGAGAAISDVLGTSPIVVTPSGASRTVSILAASGSNAGSLSSAFFNLLTNMFTATTPSTIVPDAPADPGVQSTRAARADHQHAIAAAAPGTIAIGDTADEGAGDNFARATHRHALPAPVTPQAVGAASATGSSAVPAREDHVHGFAYNREVGSNTLTGTTTTRYLASSYHSATPPIDPLDMRVQERFSVRSIGVKIRLAGTAGSTITGKLRKNGVASGTAVLTIASDATSGSATFTPVSFADGDTWGFQVDKGAAIASSPTDIIWTLGITP